ncbi:MAG: HlyD family secretion protein [Azospirillaceae bacterium]|nr:HlyD family secretion protein [Azospirillaceae bacterium]
MSDTTLPAPPPALPLWRRVGVPLLALSLAGGIVVTITTRWDAWVSGGRWQATDDAYTRADVTPLAAKVGGYVRAVPVDDFARVRVGQVLVQIDEADYRAALDQAVANVAAAEAAIANNQSQQALQRATVAAADAAIAADAADLRRYHLEATRQHALIGKGASAQQAVEEADANEARTVALLAQARAQAEAQRQQIQVLATQQRQLEAALAAQKAQLDQARLNLGYTRITAPADGEVGERQVRPGQLVSPGTQVIAVVPLPGVWVVANYKETQLTHVQPGQPARVEVDTFPGQKLTGHVEALAPASGAQFALLPPDNATGNFTKVVQRVPVKIRLDPGQPLLDRLRPGLSVRARIDTGDQ